MPAVRCCYLFLFLRFGDQRHLHSFPTRRSSDLLERDGGGALLRGRGLRHDRARAARARVRPLLRPRDTNPPMIDRKSTRLNSSHTVISYAVFCLKKKTQTEHVVTERSLPYIRIA